MAAMSKLVLVLNEGSYAQVRDWFSNNDTLIDSEP